MDNEYFNWSNEELREELAHRLGWSCLEWKITGLPDFPGDTKPTTQYYELLGYPPYDTDKHRKTVVNPIEVDINVFMSWVPNWINAIIIVPDEDGYDVTMRGLGASSNCFHTNLNRALVHSFLILLDRTRDNV